MFYFLSKKFLDVRKHVFNFNTFQKKTIPHLNLGAFEFPNLLQTTPRKTFQFKR